MKLTYLLTLAFVFTAFGALAHADIDPLYSNIYCEGSPSKLVVKKNKLTYQGKTYKIDADSFTGYFRKLPNHFFSDNRTNYDGRTHFVASSTSGDTIDFLFTITPVYETDGHNYVLGNITLKDSSDQVIEELEGCTQNYGI